ncbi:MAG TPA: RidA family protein [Kofleriaceae bacterium]|nr:RidA family protein [Kofleriaceae bacterium]
MTNTISFVTVPEWPRPKGYANGAIGQGRVLHIAGQIASTPDGRIANEDGLVGEMDQALDNVLAVLRAAGGEPQHIASMIVYTTDVQAYEDNAMSIGRVWREKMGNHYPAMALFGVTRLYEKSASLELVAVAYLP